jgi:hydrogenase nickel incorporation protein HypA/HybF
MHELSFAQQVLESVIRQADAYPGCNITRMKLCAGGDLALEPASLRFALEAIAVGTCAEGADIELSEGEGSALIIEEIELDEEDDQTG